jgi:hypothetical protein
MHPAFWCRRYIIPAGIRSIKQINIPGDAPVPPDTIGDFFSNNVILIVKMLESFIA